MGRPLKTPAVSGEVIERMAAIGCTMDEMVVLTGLSDVTLRKRFLGVIEKGRAQRKQSLRHKQTEMALQGDRTMLIWLGKQDLGQRDRFDYEVSGKDGGPITYADLSAKPEAEVVAEAEALCTRAARRAAAARGEGSGPSQA